MRERQKCFDCGTFAPATETNYTLISSTHGWRLTRRVTDAGLVLEWRCPNCWTAYRNAKIAAGEPVIPTRSSVPPRNSMGSRRPPAPRGSSVPPSPPSSRHLVDNPDESPEPAPILRDPRFKK